MAPLQSLVPGIGNRPWAQRPFPGSPRAQAAGWNPGILWMMAKRFSIA
jgi:hypothetical protein